MISIALKLLRHKILSKIKRMQNAMTRTVSKEERSKRRMKETDWRPLKHVRKKSLCDGEKIHPIISTAS